MTLHLWHEMYALHVLHLAVAFLTGHPGADVSHVLELHVVGKVVDADPGNRLTLVRRTPLDLRDLLLGTRACGPASRACGQPEAGGHRRAPSHSQPRSAGPWQYKHCMPRLPSSIAPAWIWWLNAIGCSGPVSSSGRVLVHVARRPSAVKHATAQTPDDETEADDGSLPQFHGCGRKSYLRRLGGSRRGRRGSPARARVRRRERARSPARARAARPGSGRSGPARAAPPAPRPARAPPARAAGWRAAGRPVAPRRAGPGRAPPNGVSARGGGAAASGRAFVVERVRHQVLHVVADLPDVVAHRQRPAERHGAR